MTLFRLDVIVLERLTMKKTSFPVSRLVAALGLALGVAGAAHAAVETTRVIVSFKPGSAAAHLARAAIAKAGGQI
jgi:tripartite-type tricarboxylate transporter receptor subunit TctC